MNKLGLVDGPNQGVEHKIAPPGTAASAFWFREGILPAELEEELPTSTCST